MRDLSLHILDMFQNSITAKASKIMVKLLVDITGILELVISDDGIGMDADFLEKVEDPFVTTRTDRKVGLGISLLKANAEVAGGSFEISSKPGKGTTVKAKFVVNHIDRIPLGNLDETFISLIVSNPSIEFYLQLKNEENSFIFCTDEVKDGLGGVSITNYEILSWIKEYIHEGTINIFGGVLNEINR